MEINCVLTFSVEYPFKSHKSHKFWQESDNYLDDDIQIQKIFRILFKGLIEITQANPGGGDSDNEESARQNNRRV
jgi:hypothetical protein